MKKMLSLLLISILCFSAAGALAADYTASGLFTFTFDDAYTLDDTTYISESTEDSRWLFILTDGNTAIEADLEKIEEYEDLSLFSASEEELENYVNDFLDVYVDEDAKLIHSMTVSPQNIPFYIFELTDAEGTCYLAETIVKGHAIDFWAYYYDGADADDALFERLEAVLATFVPEQ